MQINNSLFRKKWTKNWSAVNNFLDHSLERQKWAKFRLFNEEPPCSMCYSLWSLILVFLLSNFRTDQYNSILGQVKIKHFSPYPIWCCVLILCPKVCWLIHQCFSNCRAVFTECQEPLCFSLSPAQRVGWGWAKGWERTKSGQLTPANQRNTD